MKKFLVLSMITLMTVSTANAIDAIVLPAEPKAEKQEVKIHRENAFEKRLNLTDKQKVKAREIRIKGHEKMKPVMERIAMKKQEAIMVKMSRIAIRDQEERLAVIDAEIKDLEKKANEIRKQNMKEFESILTRKQRQILKEMKKEGRQRYQAEHPDGKPMMPPPATNK